MPAEIYTVLDAESEDFAEQDMAHGALARSVAELIEASMLTEVGLDEVREATRTIEQVTQRLKAATGTGSLGTVILTDGHPRNHGNAVKGLRNPIAQVREGKTTYLEDHTVVYELELGAAYEGPPTLVHGGVSALILDQLLGEAAAVGGSPGMTGRLTVHYRRPTPLGKLRAEGRLDSTDGRKSIVKGWIKDADGNVTVEAEGLFIFPKWAQDHPDWQRRREQAGSRFE